MGAVFETSHLATSIFNTRTRKMASHATEDPKPDGAAFDTFFDSIGNKAENLTINDQNGTNDPASNGAESTDKPDENEPKVVDEIESLCMNCQENGITRLLLTRIPFFREIIIMSFFCPHCNFKNSEIQAAGEIQQKGSHYELRLRTSEDFARQVVKSDTCVVKFIELDIEVPAGRGQLTNVEGLLSMILEDLEVGVGNDQEALEPAAAGQPTAESFESDDIIPNEVYSFPATCPGCTRHCVTHMKMVEIPHFKQVVIMSTVCEECGYRSNEVKTGGEVPEKGKKIILHVNGATDLARDILKSESCALECPELNLSVNPGTLGGRFTTVEGLLTQVRDDLHQQIFDVGDDSGAGGDSLPSEEKTTWKSFFDGLNEAISRERKFTVVLKDPLASSYVQNLCSPADDPQIETEDYERTQEEEEDLGLLDMQTENYVDEIGDEKKRIEDEKKEEDSKEAKKSEESNG